MPVKFTATLTGNIRGIKSVLASDALYRDAMKDLLDEVGKKGVEIARANAPYDTGALRQGITFKPMYSHSPMAIEFQSTTTNKGFNYGWLLNKDVRWHHVGWFTRPLQSLSSVLGPMFRTAMSKIERKWTEAGR